MGYTEDVFEALDIQDRLQPLYTSGTVFHTFLGEKLPDWKAAAALVRKIAENYELPYYTISPTYSVCVDHGYLPGEQYTCPHCGKKTEVYSRITGYYRPVQNWNDGKSQEFQDRKTYRPDISCPPDKAQPQKTQKALADKLYLFTTKTCPNCRIVKPMLERAGISYEVMDAEENLELAQTYHLTQAPSLVAVTGDTFTVYPGVSAIQNFISQQ